MEDKSFELITKMYSDMMDFRKDVTEQFKEVKKDIKELKKDVVRIENDLVKLPQRQFLFFHNQILNIFIL